MAETLRLQQRQLYVADTVLNGEHHTYGANVLDSGVHTSNTYKGITYKYVAATQLWSITGTATADSSKILINSVSQLPEGIQNNHTYKLSIDSFSSGDLVPLRISFYKSGSLDFYVDYPSGQENQTLASISPVEVKIPSSCDGIKIEFFIVSGRTINSQILYTLIDEEDTRITTLTYGDTYQLVVSGGSGTGALVYSVVPGTGSGSIDSDGNFTFVKPGTVSVKAYKEASRYGTTYYEKSKTLVVQLTLKQKRVTVSVDHDVVREIGQSIPPIESDNYNVEGLIGSDTLKENPEVYYVYKSDDFFKFLGSELDYVQMFDRETWIEGITKDGVTMKYLPDEDCFIINGRCTSSENEVYFDIVSGYTGQFYNYMKPGQQYYITVEKLFGDYEVGTTGISPRWWNSDTDIWYLTVINSELIECPEKFFKRFALSLFVEKGKIYRRAKIRYSMKLWETSGRTMDKTKVGQYPISARYAEPPEKDEYDPDLQYRSKFLIYQNTKSYSISSYVNDPSVGKIALQTTSAIPGEEVRFVVSCNVGTYFTDAYSDPSITSNLIVQGSSGSVTYERIGTPTTLPDDPTHLTYCTYKFTMPASNVQVRCSFPSVTEVTGWTFPYHDDTSYLFPYHEQDYIDALKFCFYGRRYFYSHDPGSARFLSGWDSDPDSWFYAYYTGVPTDPDRTIMRKDIVATLRRLSHGYDMPYQPESSVTVLPDIYYEGACEYTNTPYSRVFSYAGYDPYLKYYYGTSEEPNASYSQVKVINNRNPQIIQDNSWVLTHMPYADYARDSYLQTYKNMNDLAWAAWIGILRGFNDISVGANLPASYQDAATVVWRYAKFRQKDIHLTMEEARGTTYSEDDYWAMNGPINWCKKKGLLFNTTAAGATLTAKANIDRADFAHMIYRFCQLYGW